MATAHNRAEPGDYAPLVLMPGDPRRARRIAETLFDDARLVNEVRGMEAYTGTVGGRPISVMGSGMGLPTMTIYATELFRFYGVERIIRVGTSGGYAPGQELGDVIIASGAHTDSAINEHRIPGITLAPVASFPLLRAAAEAAEEQGTRYRVGPVFSSDLFYAERPQTHEGLRDHGTLGVDMETAALYAVAAAEGREALTVLTVTDQMFGAEAMSPEDREHQFSSAASIAITAGLSS
ncbi:purine-nucleoside phosphorylase [Brevibacterium sp.]|uniref:purine-nucleoside phosphorylase n=1 Tax=Brevibacterium sp. TaxID=1701 RepID=UPI002810B830|nr:purine-nucleoside phosphorylase [Brevibacterium sp.]